MQLKTVSAKEAKPQPKGQIAVGEQSYDNSYSNEYSPRQQSANSYYGQQPYFGSQSVQQHYAPQQVDTQYTPDYTDDVEKQAVEEENTLDAEAEGSNPSAYTPETEEHKDIDDTTDSLGDLTDPNNPLFGKYDVPSPTKPSVFCPPCGKYCHHPIFNIIFITIIICSSGWRVDRGQIRYINKLSLYVSGCVVKVKCIYLFLE